MNEINAFLEMNPNHPMRAVFEALIAREFGLVAIRPGDFLPSLPDASALLYLDDREGRGPIAFHADGILAEADSVVIAVNSNEHAAGILLDGARKLGRSVLIETRNPTAWTGHVAKHAKDSCLTTIIVPPTRH